MLILTCNHETHSDYDTKSSSSRGGECTSLLGPGEPYTPNSEKDTSCLGPVEPYAPSTRISELIVLAHIGKKREPKGRPTTLAGPTHLARVEFARRRCFNDP